MLKPLLFLFATTLAGPALGQARVPTPTEIAAVPRNDAGAVAYSAVVPAEGVAKDALYTRAKTWVINTYQSPKDVTVAEDKDAGILICKGFTEESVKIMFMQSPERLYFTVKITVKEGRYKYELTDFFFQAYSNSTEPNPKQVPAETYLTNSYYANGKGNKIAQNFARALLDRVPALQASITKAMQADAKDDF